MKTYEKKYFCEFDAKAVTSYCAIHNITEDKNLGDITQVDVDKLETVDLLTHGSPCQSFSFIGAKEGGDEDSGTKSSLMWYTVKNVKKTMPKVVIWENVKAVLSPNNIHNFNKYIEQLDELGYNSYWEVTNPKFCNIPQNRERLFVVSIRKDIDNHQFKFPEHEELTADMFDYLDREVDEKYIVPAQVMTGYSNKTSIFKKRWLLKQPGDCAYCLTTKSGRAVITNNYVFNDWDLYKNLPCALNDIDWLAAHPDVKVRSLTPLEYWRLQCFPEEMFYKAQKVGVSDAQLYKQAGNSINVEVIYRIFKNLYLAIPGIFDGMTYGSLFSGIGAFEVALDRLYKEIQLN